MGITAEPCTLEASLPAAQMVSIVHTMLWRALLLLYCCAN